MRQPRFGSQTTFHLTKTMVYEWERQRLPPHSGSTFYIFVDGGCDVPAAVLGWAFRLDDPVMTHHGDLAGTRTLLSPLALADQLAGAADPACKPIDSRACSIQHFNRLPPEIDLPGLSTDVLVGHLTGPYLMEGTGSDQRRERRWINPGQVGVTPTGQSVHRSFQGRPDIVLIHLDPGCLRKTAEEAFGCDPTHVHLVPKLAESDETADRLIRLLLAEAERPMTGSELTIDALACALTVHALRHHSSLAAPRPAVRAALSPERLRRVCDYMRANLDQPMTLAQLAAVAGLSTSQLTRAFRDATGEPPYRYLVELRIEKACELLANSELPIIEVGFQCGFPQASHFANAFRKAKGMAPRDWRRLSRI